MNPLSPLLFSLLFSFSVCLSGCSGAEHNGVVADFENPTNAELAIGPAMVSPNGTIIELEVADTPEERAQGLMFRDYLGVNAGMIFVFEQERALSFWMKNTLIPLDVVFLDSDENVVDIKTMDPCPLDTQNCPSYPSHAPARYAIEMNAGRAAELELSVGDQVQLKNISL